ncbi:lysine exporter LysO family protein [Alkalicella caledoniensis]|uniref:Lysine exporter LysO family protein n=1 Tax=Alkalicella caledoniensis TaxID=2731377 RepID=A0A7G9W4W0_ALKCA|nr:lysine exporter LysO family protein [Alkalicella caledoniensis]QNO13722.1 lysine exporter LysO family protein [Alkalicella caledoniensis]
MLIILLFVMAGYLVGQFLLKESAKKLNQTLLNYWLLGLLFVMGVSLTVDREIVSNLQALGLASLIIAFSSVLGSVLLLSLLSPLFKTLITKEDKTAAVHETSNTFLIFILGALVLGAMGGLLLPWELSNFLESTVEYLLYLLLFSVGYDLYCNRHLIGLVKTLGAKVLLIPLAIIIGTLLFSLPSAIFMPYTLGEVGAVASGFGWYSLSSIIISSTYSNTLGIIALLTNVFREVIAFIVTPLVPKILPKISGIAPAGATSMDTLLPLISKSCGSEYTVPALVSGIIISSTVYLLVPFFIEMAHRF